MACYLLHVLEQQDSNPYEDPDVKDVVGKMPQFYCTRCKPILRLTAGGGMKCIGREEPCWMPGGPPCNDGQQAVLDPWDPRRL